MPAVGAPPDARGLLRRWVTRWRWGWIALRPVPRFARTRLADRAWRWRGRVRWGGVDKTYPDGQCRYADAGSDRRRAGQALHVHFVFIPSETSDIHHASYRLPRRLGLENHVRNAKSDATVLALRKLSLLPTV